MRKLLYTLLGVAGFGCGVGMYAYASTSNTNIVGSVASCAFCEQGWDIVPKENFQNSHNDNCGDPRDPRFWIRAHVTVPATADDPKIIFSVYDESEDDWLNIEDRSIPTGTSNQIGRISAGSYSFDHVAHDSEGYWVKFLVYDQTGTYCEDDVVYDHEGNIVN